MIVDDGLLDFHRLPPPSDRDVDRLVGQVARAIHKLVDRRLAELDASDVEDDGLAHDQRDALGASAPAWSHAAPQPTVSRLG